MPLHSSIRISRDKKRIEFGQVTCFDILVILLLVVVATDAHVMDIISTGDDTKWDKLLVPVPMGIVVMSQLLVSSSVARDFTINKINKDHINLLKHPESFRTTLVQIVNESFDAFVLAHTNMEKIQLQVGQVPDYVKECVKIIMTDNKAAIDKFVPRRLEIIQKAANDGENLSKEVSDAFLHLGKLIGQVLLAISASQGAKEKEIEAEIKKQMNEDNERRKQDKEKEKKFIEEEKANAMELLQRGQESVLEERKRTRDLLEFLFFSEKKQETIDQLEKTIKEAEKRLERAKLEGVKSGQEMDKICNDFIKSLENMRVNVDDKMSTDQMIQLLKEGTKQLGALQENWAGMTTYFTSINSYIDKAMKQQQQVFINDAKDVLELGSSSVELLTDSMQKSLESSIKSHHTAATYVKVSNNYIMEPLKSMHGMLAMRPDKMAKVQDKLIQSCTNAIEGIKVMFREETQQTIKQVQSVIQSSAVKHLEL